MAEELQRPDVVGWIRNVDRQAWSLELPYEEGGAVRPMFPDLVVARKQGGSFTFDILEPHDPSRSDNVPKAIGLAQFADRHGYLFGHIELIRKDQSAGQQRYVRLDCNDPAVRREVLRASTHSQLDALFSRMARTR